MHSAADKPLEMPESAPAEIRLEKVEPAAKPEVSLLDLLIIIGRRKKFLALSTLAIGVITAIVSLLLPKWYTATTVILPPQQSTSMSSALMAQLSGMGAMGSLVGGSLGFRNPADLTMALLKSRTVEDALVDRFGLMKQYKAKKLSIARKRLESHTSMEAGVKDGLVRLSVEDPDPGRAAEMANGYVEEYKKLSSDMAVSEASQRRAFFEREARAAMDDLTAAEVALKQTEESTGMIAMEPQSKAMIEGVAALRGRVDAQEVVVRSLRSFATDQNRDLIVAEQQLATMREQLSRMEKGSGGNGGSSIADMPIDKVPAAGLEYLRKLRDVKYHEALFEVLTKQFEIAKLDEARQGAVVEVVDLAIAPDMRSFPKRTLMVLGAMFLWLVMALLGIPVLALMQAPEERERMESLKSSWWPSRWRTSSWRSRAAS